ncbi:efflux transporter periplasmic adaptor subunit, partial [Mesorhizobium sp. M2E.F.Ca.ET.154.01.1.1]
MNRLPLAAALLITASLAACSRSEEKPPEIIRPVLSMVVEPKTVETFG